MKVINKDTYSHYELYGIAPNNQRFPILNKSDKTKVIPDPEVGFMPSCLRMNGRVE
jgi:hypothetical protein